MTEDEIVSEVLNPIVSEVLNPWRKIIAIFQFIFLLALISSPLIWVWGVYDIAWKIGLTAIILMVLNTGIYYFLKKKATNAAEEALKIHYKTRLGK